MTVTLARIVDAQAALQSVIIATPMIPDDQLSRRLGARNTSSTATTTAQVVWSCGLVWFPGFSALR